MHTHPPRLAAHSATFGYASRTISTEITLEIPPQSFTAIIGPNACGKSTLLRGLARLLKPNAGSVTLDGRSIHQLPAKAVARRLGLLPQTSEAPAGIRVADLVARGRFPHQKLVKQWTDADATAVADAMDRTGISALSGRLVDELSGGQRQRVWVAMTLAQQTDLLLLDEPTTYLDITHQLELLELFSELHRTGRTLVAVLHDLNQAARYASHIVAMREGAIVAEGPPGDLITPELMRAVFDLPCIVTPDPVTGTPQVIPLRPGSAATVPNAPQPIDHPTESETVHAAP